MGDSRYEITREINKKKIKRETQNKVTLSFAVETTLN